MYISQLCTLSQSLEYIVINGPSAVVVSGRSVITVVHESMVEKSNTCNTDLVQLLCQEDLLFGLWTLFQWCWNLWWKNVIQDNTTQVGYWKGLQDEVKLF